MIPATENCHASLLVLVLIGIFLHGKLTTLVAYLIALNACFQKKEFSVLMHF